jgi:LysM repeat protein
VVRRGETLAVIAVRVGIPVERLAAHNRLPDPDRITTGQHLSLPAPTGPTDPDPTVVIAPGDTLTGLAHTHHVTPAALLAANPDLTDPDHIQAGAGLRVPTAAPPRSAGVRSGQRSR